MAMQSVGTEPTKTDPVANARNSKSVEERKAEVKVLEGDVDRYRVAANAFGNALIDILGSFGPLHIEDEEFSTGSIRYAANLRSELAVPGVIDNHLLGTIQERAPYVWHSGIVPDMDVPRTYIITVWLPTETFGLKHVYDLLPTKKKMESLKKLREYLEGIAKAVHEATGDMVNVQLGFSKEYGAAFSSSGLSYWDPSHRTGLRS